MPHSSNLRTLTNTTALSLLLLVASSAHAQTIAIPDEASLPRLDATGTPVKKRLADFTPEGVSHQDCLEDQKIRFDLLLTEVEATAELQAWASFEGMDCTSPTNRMGSMAQCWQLGGTIRVEPRPTVDISVRALLSGVPNGPSDPVRGETVCGLVDLTPLQVHFLYFAPGQLTATAAKSVGLLVDTIGPPPPDGVHAQPADGHVSVRWAAPDAGRSIVAGSVVYCDTASGGDSSCSSAGFTPGTTPSGVTDALYHCATTTADHADVTAKSNAEPFANGTSYAFGVRTMDWFGNLGPLSPLVCATPTPDSPESNEAGCTASGAGARTAWPACGLALAALLLQRLRRRLQR